MDERYILKTIKEVLKYLKEKWDQDIDDVSLRVTSPILRNLIVYGNLSRAWRLAGFTKEPQIVAILLEEELSNLPIKRVKFASAGGAIYKGMEIQGMKELDIALKRFDKSEGDRKKIVSLSAFSKSACLLIRKDFPQGIMQEYISRNVLIQYVANKLGGAHLDLERDLKKELKYTFLDDLFNGLQIAGKNAIYFELLSIGQAIINSSDVIKLLNKLEENNP